MYIFVYSYDYEEIITFDAVSHKLLEAMTKAGAAAMSRARNPTLLSINPAVGTSAVWRSALLHSALTYGEGKGNSAPGTVEEHQAGT